MSDVWTPPRAEVKDIGLSANPDALEIRQRHIGHETSIKALGLLYYLTSVGSLIAGIMFLVEFSPNRHEPVPPDMVGVFMLAMSALYFWVARGLRALKRSGRIAAGVLASIGLLGFPAGTLVNGYFLYLLFSKKGAMVFSDEYKQIIAETPDVKYRTPIIVWIVLALIIAAIGLAVLNFTVFNGAGGN